MITADGLELDDRVEDALRAVLGGNSLQSPSLDGPLVAFKERFGPGALRGLDGTDLLRRMHGRWEEDDKKSLAYWLEFKNDEEFPGLSFGSIAGGNSAKFGVYQRQSDGAWVMGWPGDGNVINVDAAAAKARQQRDELLAGEAVLAAIDVTDTSDDAYARLQAAMEKAAPDLHADGWAHKWWFLSHPDLLDCYHAPRMQRFHLVKLWLPPIDGLGTIVAANAPRFNCAGRFVALARHVGAPMPLLMAALNRLHGKFHHYWRVGTDEGTDSRWPAMRSNHCVSMGWKDQVPDMTDATRFSAADAKTWVRAHLDRSGLYPDPAQAGTATRKAGELVNLAREMEQGDLVLACSGLKVLGIGRVNGSYGYDPAQQFPHTRPVEWLSDATWTLPQAEGLRTSCVEIGRHAVNLLQAERHLADPVQSPEPPKYILPEMNRHIARIHDVLERKNQVLLYGPPGTGKTYWAHKAARELVARHAFHRTHTDLSEEEKAQVDGPGGMVRLCTFHPGYGYEDFMEGLRPRVGAAGQLVFEAQDGIFKRLCTDAAARPDRQFILVVDEFNRGDVPRIFGELLTVLEKDKRDTRVLLPVTQQYFAVPINVRLIGTMNTADRSISLLDAALRRRFGFIEMMPDSGALTGRMAGEIPLGPWLDALNHRLRKHLKRDARNLQVGHAYLVKVRSLAEMAQVLRQDLVPLLEEYCYDDLPTLAAILGKDLVDAEAGRIRFEMFDAVDSGELANALWFDELQSFQEAARASPDEATGSE